MPFNMTFDKFKYSYVQRDPDIVEADTAIYFVDSKTNKTWVCPAGAEGRCDGQSVPFLFWPLVGHPLQGTAIRAAFLHDYAYKTAHRSKGEADEMFYHALLEEDDDHPLAKYLSVKFFGRVAWWKRRRQQRKNEASRPANL